ncbi:MAG: DUF1540 domain-containing protein [Bacillota bacterium]
MAVMCTVNNCHYWASGNKCAASDILICSDELAQKAPESWDAKDAKQANATPVKNCMDTACKTFVDRGSPATNVDGATRKMS